MRLTTHRPRDRKVRHTLLKALRLRRESYRSLSEPSPEFGTCKAEGHDPGSLDGIRICVIYDCLFPWTIGGAERWYRELAEAFVKVGADVTYLTCRQWVEEPTIVGVRVIAVAPPQRLYQEDGKRRNVPPLRFGAGVFVWLARHRREIDAVHVANFPYFSLLAARLSLAGTRTPIHVDWHEVWPMAFWRQYAGCLAGRAGFLIQEICIASGATATRSTGRKSAHTPTNGSRRSTRRRGRPATLCAGGLGLATVAAGLTAVTLASPLSITIQSVTTTGQLATVSAVTVDVHNRSSRTLLPYFSLSSSDAVTTFWLVNSGPSSLKAGQSAEYNLLAPNFPAQPSINGGFQVIAFTSSPSTVSHSGSYLPTTDHLALNPDAINNKIPIGQAVVVTAELLDRLNQPIHKAGIPVYLGQIVYAQSGLVFGEAIINGSQPGQTPVSAVTNAAGVATFTIIGTHPSTDSVYFEANLVNSKNFYPYGYSTILPIRFDQ